MELSAGDAGAQLKALQEAAAVLGAVASGVQRSAAADEGSEGSKGLASMGMEEGGGYEGKEQGKRGMFPAQEMEWLVSSCWNKGAHHLRCMR